jgi:AraC-like DNA-binding protein
VQRATSDEFLASPFGRYVAGPSWVFFHAGSVSGSILWGRFSVEEARTLMGISPATHLPSDTPHGALIDSRDVTSLDPGVFDLAREYLNSHHRGLQDKIGRFALVRPEGLLGAAAAGFFTIVASPFHVRIFAERRSALDWLESRETLDELCEAELATRGGSILPAVRDAVAASLTRAPTLEGIARRMGLSARTLQRRLREEGTRFRDEVHAARVFAAKRLLAESEASITEIAFAVGYSSPTHLTDQFRRLCGVSPSAWRAQHATRA